VTRLVLPLHECAAEPLQDAAESVADPTTDEVAVDPTAAEPLHFAADPTETSCLCVWV
jgi:hypothetical protein